MKAITEPDQHSTETSAWRIAAFLASLAFATPVHCAPRNRHSRRRRSGFCSRTCSFSMARAVRGRAPSREDVHDD